MIPAAWRSDWIAASAFGSEPPRFCEPWLETRSPFARGRTGGVAPTAQPRPGSRSAAGDFPVRKRCARRRAASILQQKQLKILQNALELLAPEGRLVYSTCSLERQENEDLVDLVMAGTEGKYKVLEAHRRTPGLEPGDGFFAAVITSR